MCGLMPESCLLYGNNGKKVVKFAMLCRIRLSTLILESVNEGPSKFSFRRNLCLSTQTPRIQKLIFSQKGMQKKGIWISCNIWYPVEKSIICRTLDGILAKTNGQMTEFCLVMALTTEIDPGNHGLENPKSMDYARCTVGYNIPQTAEEPVTILGFDETWIGQCRHAVCPWLR